MLTIKKDIEAVFERDPAARNILEVIICYSGLHAIFWYRIAHVLYKARLLFIARVISQLGKLLTGVEIHPAAKIGSGFFIDHGTGIVIGETTEIGDNVTIYQGVTLGGTGKDKGKRHPTIEDNVVVCAGAKVLGPITIGKNSKIGAGAVVLREVPPNCTAVGIPARVVVKNNKKIISMHRQFDNKSIDLEHAQLPDPVFQELEGIKYRIEALEELIEGRETKKNEII